MSHKYRNPKEEEVKELLIEAGPHTTLGITVLLSSGDETVNLMGTQEVLESGNFHEDDSGRWHLGSED